MKKMIRFCTAVLLMIAVVASVYGNDLLNIYQKVLDRLPELYPNPKVRTLAEKILDDICADQKLSEAEKIKKIEEQFLKQSFKPITEVNADELIFKPYVTWDINSIAIAYDIETTAQIQTVEKFIDTAEDGETVKLTILENKSNSTTKISETFKEAKANIEISVSLNPFKWFAKADAGINAKATASKRKESVMTEQKLWSKEKQRALSKRYEKMTEVLENTKISNCHLLFSVDFHNKSDFDLFFKSDSSIPVYTDSDNHILDAKPVGISENEKKIELSKLKETRTITFRGDITNTKAKELILFMTRNSPEIKLRQGGLSISNETGTIKVAENMQKENEIIRICVPFYEWTIQKFWSNQYVTLRQALWAVNALYDAKMGPVPFKMENDKVVALEGFIENDKEISLKSFPLGIRGKQEKDCKNFILFEINGKYYDSIDKEMLDKPFPSKKINVLIIEDACETLLRNSTPNALKSFLFHAINSITKENESQYLETVIGECYYEGIGVDKDEKKAAEIFESLSGNFLFSGYSRAQCDFGDCYQMGRGIQQDLKKAAEFYEKSATQGYGKAEFKIGMCYLEGKGVEKDFSKAVEWLEKAATQGYADAQNQLGKIQYDIGMRYLEGKEGVEKNPAEAVKWFEKAVKQGCADAQNQLGDCYKNSIGIEKDDAKAFELFQNAAKQGHVLGQYNLGDCYYRGIGTNIDYKKAVECYEKAALEKCAYAQIMLGRCYIDGNGVTKDEVKAVEWFRKAAEQMDDIAQYELGLCYLHGKGVTKDLKEAAEWFKKAVEQENADAEYQLGCLYFIGDGVTLDKTEAVRLYHKAAEKGQAEAQYKFGACLRGLYGEITGIKINLKDAFSWYEKAALQGNVDGETALGDCYAVGTGVAVDIKKSAEWYEKAANHGEAYAQLYLGIYYLYGDGVEKDMNQALKWIHEAKKHGQKYADLWLKIYDFELKNNVNSYEAYRLYLDAAGKMGNAQAEYMAACCGYSDAITRFKKAANLGYAKAQIVLGKRYRFGDDVRQDYVEAVKWFRLAAEQGNADGQYNLALCYFYGVGVEKDFSIAFSLFEKAAKQGNVESQYNLAFCYFHGVGVEKDFSAAFLLFENAAKQGNMNAQYMLSVCYATGKGIKKNVKKAFDILQCLMVRVEPGTFIMEHKDGDNCADEVEHTVNLTKAFWVGKTEITQAQWEAIAGNNPSRNMDDDSPVELNSLEAVRLFLTCLNEMYKDQLPDGYEFNLLTEAQWEYAAQGGHKRVKYTKFSGSDDIENVGWYNRKMCQCVALKAPNELGLYDMTGNVWELCRDKCDIDENRGFIKTEPYPAVVKDPFCGKGTHSIKRGGAYNESSKKCRNAFRSQFRFQSVLSENGSTTEISSEPFGLRLALVPIQR